MRHLFVISPGRHKTPILGSPSPTITRASARAVVTDRSRPRLLRRRREPRPPHASPRLPPRDLRRVRITNNLLTANSAHPRTMSWAPALFGDVLLSKDGAEVKTEEALADKVVGIYFSAHWCVPDRPRRARRAIAPPGRLHRNARPRGPTTWLFFPRFNNESSLARSVARSVARSSSGLLLPPRSSDRSPSPPSSPGPVHLKVSSLPRIHARVRPDLRPVEVRREELRGGVRVLRSRRVLVRRVPRRDAVALPALREPRREERSELQVQGVRHPDPGDPRREGRGDHQGGPDAR